MYIEPESLITKNLSKKDIDILDELENSEKSIYEAESIFGYPIKVVENRLGLFLKFSESYQAAKIKTPIYEGNIPYVNYFFLSCLYTANVKNILVIGLGAGYFINMLQEFFPDTNKIDVVEIEPEVIDIAQDYFDFVQNKPIKIHYQDAAVFLRNTKTKYDLIIMDVFSENGIEKRFLTKSFFNKISNSLSQTGLFATNLFANKNLDSDKNNIFKSILKTIKVFLPETVLFKSDYANEIFYKELIGLKGELSDLTNIIVFASRQKLFCNNYETLPKKYQHYYKNKSDAFLNLEKVDTFQ